MDLYLRQHWEDPRLNHNSINEPMDLNDPKLVQAIWKPEVYFPNAKEGEFQYVTVPNVLLRIEPAGHILYMLRYEILDNAPNYWVVGCIIQKRSPKENFMSQ